MQNRLKNSIFLITYAIILYFILSRINHLGLWLLRIFMVFTPFIYGFVIAYLVNWPYMFFKNKVFSRISRLEDKKYNNAKNIMSLIAAYIILFGVIAFLLVILIPQLTSSIQQLINNLSGYISSLDTTIDKINRFFHTDKISSDYIENILNSLNGNINKMLSDAVPKMFNVTKSFTTGIYNFAMGIIISMYFLGNKDLLINQIKKLFFVVFPDKINTKLMEILVLTHSKFGKFIIGKIVDSIIIGVLCFIGMNIIRLPYAVLISVIVGFTNIIPFFGPFIGAIPSIFILLMIDPMYGVWFSIFILLLQQIDANIIGPKILGNTIGISSMWIMFSVLIGGGLFGVVGMFVSVPIFAVIYSLMSEFINKRVSYKNE